MTIRFICPNCGAIMAVAEQFAGQTGPCASCGRAITIPLARPGMRRPRAKRLLLALGALATLLLAAAAVLAAWWLPATLAAQDVTRRARCAANLRRIATAMVQYEAANGCFPPAYVADKHGKPMYSWRVLLLPYLDLEQLADQFHFDEPWDSEANHSVSDLALDVYQCPAQPGANGPMTNYLMVVGPHTISDGREPRRIAEITDGLSDTIMLVEVADSDVGWAEPRDLHDNKLTFVINGEKRQEISSYHRRGANVALCDGSVRFLRNATTPQEVKAMLTIDGGKKASAE